MPKCSRHASLPIVSIDGKCAMAGAGDPHPGMSVCSHGMLNYPALFAVLEPVYAIAGWVIRIGMLFVLPVRRTDTGRAASR
jgi:hypothetical protein